MNNSKLLCGHLPICRPRGFHESSVEQCGIEPHIPIFLEPISLFMIFCLTPLCSLLLVVCMIDAFGWVVWCQSITDRR